MSRTHSINLNQPTCLAIDLGAASGRLVLGQIRDGRWNLTDVGRFRTPVKLEEASGYQYWDIDSILGAIEQCLVKMPAAEKPVSLGIDSWGVDYVLLDQELNRVGLPVCYRDTGCQNRLLNQLCADACGLPVTAGPVEASVLGNLSAQLIALGVIADLRDARESIRHSFEIKRYEPMGSVPVNVFKRLEDLLAARAPRGEACA